MALGDTPRSGRRVRSPHDSGAHGRGEAACGRPRRAAVSKCSPGLSASRGQALGAASRRGSDRRGSVRATGERGDGHGGARVPARARNRAHVPRDAVTPGLADRACELRFGEILNPSAHPAIVDTRTWQAVRRMRSPRGQRPKSERLLARLGVLRCETCGAVPSRPTVTPRPRGGRRGGRPPSSACRGAPRRLSRCRRTSAYVMESSSRSAPVMSATAAARARVPTIRRSRRRREVVPTHLGLGRRQPPTR